MSSTSMPAYHLHRILSGALLALLLSLPGLTVQADTAWPESEDGAASAGFTEQGMEELDAAMRRIVSDQDVAGMVWLLARNGKVATFDHAGLARVDDDAPMTRDSLFRIYSMTKPVTGVALMMLHEEGLWEFDDPVSKHVPEFAGLKVMTSYDEEGNRNSPSQSRQPTMRELLNHSAGFGYGLSGDDPVNNAFRETRALASSDLDELIENIADIPLLYDPGEEWVYSIAVDIQGYIVQKLSGMRFGEFLEQRMFLPLGMTDTRFYVQEQDRPRFAEVHNWDEERGTLVQRPIAATGQLSGSEPDRVRWRRTRVLNPRLRALPANARQRRRTRRRPHPDAGIGAHHAHQQPAGRIAHARRRGPGRRARHGFRR